MKIQCVYTFWLVVIALTCPIRTAQSASVHSRALRLRSLDSVPERLVEVRLKPKNETTTHTITSNLWKSDSKVNHLLSLFFAAVWVLVLGSTPVGVYWWGDKIITRSAIILSCAMWIALFGGLYLFTNIILFSSPHFDEVRSLTVIECCYFMTQVITTVGYGDITPAKPRGQVFVGLYVAFAFFVIAVLISEMQAVVATKVDKYKEVIVEKAHALRPTESNRLLKSHKSFIASETEKAPLTFKPESPSLKPLFNSLGIFFSVAAVWTIFFSHWPGEKKAISEAIYMALITLTTVGFGAFTPVTEGGMMFSAFFMFIGTTALVNVVQNFSTFVLEMDEYEKWTPQKFKDDLKQWESKTICGGRELSELDFMRLALVQKGLMSQEAVDDIMTSYQAMIGKRGTVTLKSIAQFHEGADEGHPELGGSDTETNTETNASSPRSRNATPRLPQKTF